MDEAEKQVDTSGGFSSADIAGAIAKLREHPEIISAVAGALSGREAAQKQKEASDTKSDEASSASPFPIEKISEVMTTLAPMLSEMGGTHVHKEITGNRDDHRNALLHALRPYLSRDRREMIDYILRFGKIGDLIKKMK